MTQSTKILTKDLEIPHLVTAPKVTLVAKTLFDQEFLEDNIYENENSYTDRHEHGEYLVEFAGRACYQSFHNPAGRSTDGYITNIINQKHFSVLEHANVTFYIEGVSRSLTHELVRHRHFSYSQLSQRYVDSQDARFVIPPAILGDDRLEAAFSSGVQLARESLGNLERDLRTQYPDYSQKQIREAARSVAPNSIETKIVVTGNLRAWRDYLEKRWNSHADAEIQRLSQELYTQLSNLYPSVFKDIVYQ